MEDNSTSTDGVNITDEGLETIVKVTEQIVVCTGLPLTLVAIVAVSFLTRKDHGAPVYIINLLISDLIQLCCLAAWQISLFHDIIDHIHSFGLMASVGFMVCISLERYLAITKPLWYRFRHNIRITVLVCVVVWTLPLVYVLPQYFSLDFQLSETVYPVFFLLPLPLFIFFLVGTLKALSAARSVPDDEKRRIVAILVAVLLIYILLFFPISIFFLVEKANKNRNFQILAHILLYLSPLADSTLYFFIRKGAIDTLLKSLCWKMSQSQEND